jgi:hypothetical protein
MLAQFLRYIFLYHHLICQFYIDELDLKFNSKNYFCLNFDIFIILHIQEVKLIEENQRLKYVVSFFKLIIMCIYMDNSQQHSNSNEICVNLGTRPYKWTNATIIGICY